MRFALDMVWCLRLDRHDVRSGVGVTSRKEYAMYAMALVVVAKCTLD